MENLSRVAMQVSRNVLVASIQVDLTPSVMAQFQEDLLREISVSEVRGAVLDLSGLPTLDGEEFTALARLLKMVSLLGTRPVLAGLRPGIVSALVDLDVDIEGIEAALSIDDAFQLLESAISDKAEEPELDDAPELVAPAIETTP